MATSYIEAIPTAPRLLLEATLVPIAGSRFQPTGFPNLGAAEYVTWDGVEHILVESAQSIANRLEMMAWDDARGDLVSTLHGIPYVSTIVEGVPTDSIREAHRLNSPYLEGIYEPLRARAEIKGTKKANKAKKVDAAAKPDDGDAAAVVEDSTSVDIRKLAAAVFAYDPNSVLHGIFLTKIVGLARLTRLLSGFIEAHDVRIVASGGVKNDRIDPSGKRHKTSDGKGGAEAGFGNVPFARSEYTAKTILASFSMDVALLRSYGLPEPAQRLLVELALWKIQRFLDSGLRLRTACDLEMTENGLRVRRPNDMLIPSLAELDDRLPRTIRECADAGLFVEGVITKVPYGT